MTESLSENTKMPAHVKIPLFLAFSLALLLTPISVLSCLAGLLVDDRILLIGLLIGLLVALLIFGCRGLKDGWRWSRQLLVTVSSLAFFGLLTLIGYLDLTGGFDPDRHAAIVWLLAGPLLIFETIALMLTSKSASPWFEASGSGFPPEVMQALGEYE